jgi:lysophospholipase III
LLLDEHEDYFYRLKLLVEDTYTINNDSKVSLLAHSMGGLMSLYFLQRQNSTWKDKYIERLVTMSTPWGGAVKAVKVFAIGEYLNVRKSI